MENQSIDLGIPQNQFSTMKYSQLRKAAKRYSINANQKREVLIMELSKIWNHHECNKENIAPSKVTGFKVALSCSPKDSLNDTLNQTFTIEHDSSDNMKPCTEKIATNEDSVESESILQRAQEINFVPLDDSTSNRKMKKNMNTPYKGKSVVPGELVARFATLHQKLVEKQPTLQEADANVKRKFAEHEKAVPNIFKRLATPKFSNNTKHERKAAVEITGHKFKNVDEDPSKMNFSFSKLYGTKNAFTTVQNNTNIASQSKIPLRRPRMLEVGVKELTKRLNTKQVRRSPRLAKLAKHTNSVTVPQLSTRLQRLAIPKGKKSEVSLTESEEKTLRRCGRRYVPYRRMIPYVDTTKMTDNQFHEAKMLGQIQTLTAVSTSRTEMRQQLSLKRHETRERILKAKRRC